MDRKKLVLLLGALVVAIGTALAARSMFAGSATPQVQAQPVPVAQGPKVLVAKRALPVGTIITADAIGYQLWPKEMVQDAYFVDGEADMTKLLGTVVRYPVTAGEPVTQGSLVSVAGGNDDHAIVTARYGGSMGDGAHWRVYGKYLARASTQTPAGADANDAWSDWRGGFRMDWPSFAVLKRLYPYGT